MQLNKVNKKTEQKRVVRADNTSQWAQQNS
jgi:hypothetical protein